LCMCVCVCVHVCVSRHTHVHTHVHTHTHSHTHTCMHTVSVGNFHIEASAVPFSEAMTEVSDDEAGARSARNAPPAQMAGKGRVPAAPRAKQAMRGTVAARSRLLEWAVEGHAAIGTRIIKRVDGTPRLAQVVGWDPNESRKKVQIVPLSLPN